MACSAIATLIIVQADTNKIRNVAGVVATLVWFVSFVHALLIRRPYLELMGAWPVPTGKARARGGDSDRLLPRLGWGSLGVLIGLVAVGTIVQGTVRAFEIFPLRDAPLCTTERVPGCREVVRRPYGQPAGSTSAGARTKFHVELSLPEGLETVELAYGDDASAFRATDDLVDATVWKGRVILVQNGAVSAETTEEPTAAAVNALSLGPFMCFISLVGVLRARGEDDLGSLGHPAIAFWAVLSVGPALAHGTGDPRPGTVGYFLLGSLAVAALLSVKVRKRRSLAGP